MSAPNCGTPAGLAQGPPAGRPDGGRRRGLALLGQPGDHPREDDDPWQSMTLRSHALENGGHRYAHDASERQ